MSNTAVGFIIAMAVIVIAVSGWVIYSRNQPVAAPAAPVVAAGAPAPAPVVAAPADPTGDTQAEEAARLARERDAAVVAAQQARAELEREQRLAREAEAVRQQAAARARQQQQAVSVVGRWGGDYTIARTIYVIFVFNRDGSYLSETHSDVGNWRQSGANVTWVDQNGMRFEGRISGQQLSGSSYRPDGSYAGEFTLSRM